MLDSVTIGVELIGFAAAFLTTIAFIPQVIQVWKSKSVEGLSLTTYIIFIIGVFLWFLYGLSIGSLSMIIANFITVLLASVIIYFIIKSKIN
ncbi:MAG: SemiSWEET transporter [Flavobacteriaceae bacterium]|jgi:MtN3 and saliva related transmembrane protein|tara:strand:- start:221 stop:496 length:276 start_codon:yes stop_codon:yes gene_type:complete